MIQPTVRLFQRLHRDDAGATILEFAVVAPVFFLMFMGIIEFGLVMFSKVAIESATMQVSRESGVGKGSANRVEYIKDLLADKTHGLINSSQIIITANKVADGGAPPPPDICMDRDPPSTAPRTCKKYQEVNGMKGYQGNADSALLGSANDLVEIRISYPWKVQLPFVNEFFGCHTVDKEPVPGCQRGVIMLSSSTVVKNEPF